MEEYPASFVAANYNDFFTIHYSNFFRLKFPSKAMNAFSSTRQVVTHYNFTHKSLPRIHLSADTLSFCLFTDWGGGGWGSSPALPKLVHLGATILQPKPFA